MSNSQAAVTTRTSSVMPKFASVIPAEGISDACRRESAALAAELPTRLVWDSRPVELVPDDDGAVWRRAFRIALAAEHCGENGAEFVIILREGATSFDLELARMAVACAKQGDLSAWAPCRFAGCGELVWVWRHLYPHDPERHHYGLRPCSEAACTEEVHTYTTLGEQADFHCGERIEHPDGAYSVQLMKVDGEPWEPSADLSCFPGGAAGTKAARDLANDFAWLQQEADRLNAAAEFEQGQSDGA